MRMTSYYGGLAALAPPALLVTAWIGMSQGGTPLHLGVGLFTAIYCVALQTLLIMFMIVTGRVLKAAMSSRPLRPEFLTELNDFFSNKKAYPAAILVATLTVTTAVLGYGRNIGVPMILHPLFGIATVIANLWSIGLGVRTLRSNQELLDRVASELDRIDAEEPESVQAPEDDWKYPPATRWFVFALSAWLPLVYWGLVVWRGDFSRISTALVVASALASGAGLLRALALRSRAA